MTSTTVVATKKPRRKGSSAKAFAWIIPGYFFFIAFLLIPLLLTVLLSFTDWNGFSYDQIRTNGIDNYIRLAKDTVFLQALVHNVAFLLGSVVLKTVLALALALAFRRAFPLSNLFQGIFLVPTTLSLVVVGIVLKFVLDPNNGLINPLLTSIGLGSFAGSWLADPSRALPILIFLDVWVGFGLYLFIFLSSMSSLPGDVFEAAKVDGAGSWKETIYVTIPMLADTIKLVVLLAAIDSLKVFATIYVSTGGGPNHATEVLSTWAFFQAFSGNQVGYGSAILVVLLVITLILAFFYTRQSRADRKSGDSK
ncbi:carbohydrate ABC transporter permease [Glaciibacter superstes]|uniref:carbohydrate ABC transporter permease n=1 Tax=Glaciibacter superstes TaxID=501023 RepID=UPI0003B53D68|nr:sugar ABC transporter permease [Glaciibacter superstes]